MNLRLHEPDALPHDPVRVEDAVCLLCGGAEAEPIASGRDYEYRTSARTFTFVRCGCCGHVYLNPRPTLASAAAIYPATYYTVSAQKPGWGMRLLGALKDRVTSRRIAALVADVPLGGSVLDVGCGDGALLRCLRQTRPDLHLVGLDLQIAVHHKEALHGLRIETIEAPLESAALPGRFDLIVMNQLIEHLWDVRGCLERIAAALSPGGRLSVSTPDLDGRDRRWFSDSAWGGYYFPRHLNLFTRATLERLVRECGLEPVVHQSLAAPIVWRLSLFNALSRRGSPLRHVCKDWNLPLLSVCTLLDVIACWRGRTTSNQQLIVRKPPACVMEEAA